MVKAITFDLDGVYFKEGCWGNFMKNLPKKITDEEKIKYVLVKSPEMTAFRIGNISEENFWNFARRELEIRVDNEGIFKSLRDSYEINPEVSNFVKEVRAKGLKTCICSSNTVTRTRELNKKFDFFKDFDVRVFSFEVGIAKPDKGIFEELVRQTGCQANEIIYADDNEISYQSALSVGINAFLYTGFEDFKKNCLSALA